jgi:hypothetical protein
MRIFQDRLLPAAARGLVPCKENDDRALFAAPQLLCLQPRTCFSERKRSIGIGVRRPSSGRGIDGHCERDDVPVFDRGRMIETRLRSTRICSEQRDRS